MKRLVNCKSSAMLCGLVLALSVHGQPYERLRGESGPGSRAYKVAALGLIIADANQVASELGLDENLPIVESNLVRKFIPPEQLGKALGAIGNITTSNYTYYFSVNNKFSFLTKSGFDREYQLLERQYMWPMERMDTNAAFRLAEQWLKKVSVDVEALDRDCTVQIKAFIPEGGEGQHFVPVYWVYWMNAGKRPVGSVASVELLLPTKSLRQLRVEMADYIRRNPLEVHTP